MSGKTGLLALILFAFFCFCPPLGASKKETREQLQECLAEKDEALCLELLIPLKGVPDTASNQLIEWASTEPGVSLLRMHLVNRFARSLPQNINEEVEGGLKTVLLALVKTQFEYLAGRKHHSSHDIESIKQCLRLVGRMKLHELFYPVAPYMAYPLVDVRHAAFFALGRLDDDRLYPILAKLSKSPKPVERTYALDALYYIKDERTVPMLVDALHDKNKSVRYYAIRTLEKMRRTEVSRHLIKVVQEDPDNEVRIKAIQVLGDFRPRSAFYTLAKNMADSDPAVRRENLKALLKYNSKNACHYISTQLERETEDALKLQQIKALLELNHTGGMAGLKEAMSNEKNINIRLWAIFVTGHFKDHRGFNSVLANLSHSNEKVRAEAALALARYKDRKALDRLLNLLVSEKESYFVQSAVVYALKQIDDSKPANTLVQIARTRKNRYIKKQIEELVRHLAGS